MGDRAMTGEAESAAEPASERGLRLKRDYECAQEALERAGVAHAIVIFGSTRIVEPAAALQALQRIQERAPPDPGSDPAGYLRFQQELAIAGRLAAKSRYYEIARELGRKIGAASLSPGAAHDPQRILVMTGGGPGLMEAANRGAAEVGAQSIGLNIALPHEQIPNAYVTPELCLRFRYFAIRKLHFVLRARALVALPGGFGTFDELFEALTLIQTRRIEPVPVVLVGREYWRRAFDVDFLVAEGVIDRADRDLFWYGENAEEVWASILQWHRDRGAPLLFADDRPSGRAP